MGWLDTSLHLWQNNTAEASGTGMDDTVLLNPQQNHWQAISFDQKPPDSRGKAVSITLVSLKPIPADQINLTDSLPMQTNGKLTASDTKGISQQLWTCYSQGHLNLINTSITNTTARNLIVKSWWNVSKVLRTLKILFTKDLLLHLRPVMALRQCFLVDGLWVIQQSIAADEPQFLLTLIKQHRRKYCQVSHFLLFFLL